MHSRFYLSLLLISSVVLFVFLALESYRELAPEWKAYQTDYRDFLIKNAKDESERRRAKAIKTGIQQVYLESLKRADRCISCHIGIENPLMAGAEQPFRQHSGDYLENHPVADFGCTVCHHGQGRATNKKEAHGEGRDTHWDFPIMPLKYVQSSCAVCHDFEMLKQEGGGKIARGEELFREKGCKGCHKLGGVGGDLGKELDGVGSRPIAYFPMKYVVGSHTAYNWHKQHLDDPRAVVSESEMRVFLTDEESDLLTTYILSLRVEEMPRNYMLIKNIRTLEYDGEALYKMYCIACHDTGKYSVYDEILKRTIPAIMNPTFLRTIDDKHLRNFIKDGRIGTQMTAWKTDAAGLTENEIDKIIKYITKDRPDEKAEPFGYARFKPDIRHGEEIYKVRCAFCHGEEGKGGVNLLGINLRNPAVQNADPEFLAMTIRDGREGTPMVPFGEEMGRRGGVPLQVQDIADVVAYIRTLSQKE